MKHARTRDDRVVDAGEGPEQWAWPPELPPLRIHPAHIPRRARYEWPYTDGADAGHGPGSRPDPQVAVRAAMTYIRVADPANGEPWSGAQTPDELDRAARPAFAQTVTMLQEDAVTVSLPYDDVTRERAEQAAHLTGEAEDARDRTDRIRLESVEYPPGTASTVGQALDDHAADRDLAAERREHGSLRHEDEGVARHWIVAAASLLAFLDVALLWRPLLGLGVLVDAGALYKWGMAVGFATLQAFFIDLAVHQYRDAERDSTERRDRMEDHNRRIRRALARSDEPELAVPPPPVTEVDAADDRLRTRRRWLDGAAVAVGAVGAVRVAFLSRAAGQLVPEAILFGAVVGLVLGGLVVLLGRLACRGNRLGDRMRAGAAVQLAVDARVVAGRAEVADACGQARDALLGAERARAWAVDVREWVVAQYRLVVLLATSWLDLPRPPVEDNALINPRRIEVADAAAKLIDAVELRLAALDGWLGAATAADDDAAPAALPAGDPAGAEIVPFLAPASGFGGDDGLLGIEVALDAPPAEPRWLVAAGAALVVAVAVAAALIAPTPEGQGPAITAGGGPLPEITIGG